MKKTKMFLTIGMSALLMSSCANGEEKTKEVTTTNTEEQEEKVDEVVDEEEGIDGKDINGEVEYLKVNMDYYNYCKAEYKHEIKSGDLIAYNGNGIEILTAKIKGKDEMANISLFSDDENKGNLLDEINKVLKMNNYDEMTKEEFDNIAWGSLTKKMGIELTEKGRIKIYEIEKENYIEKGDIIITFIKGKNLGFSENTSKTSMTHYIGFMNKDSFLKMKESEKKESGEEKTAEQ